MALPILLIGFVRKQIIKQVGGFMFKRIMKWLAPKVIELLTEALDDWAEDPNTDTDDVAINAVGDYLKYLADKWLT